MVTFQEGLGFGVWSLGFQVYAEGLRASGGEEFGVWAPAIWRLEFRLGPGR